MSNQAYNPIKSVVAVNIDGSPVAGAVTYTNMPIPVKYEYQVTDNSAPDAGRTEDQAMHKMKIGQSVKITVGWKYLSGADMKSLLTIYDSEYINAEVLSPKDNAWITKRFYVGDRSAPLWNSTRGLWEGLDFSLIQQNADIT